MAADMARVARPEGQALAVTNHRKTSQARLQKMLHEAARDAGRRVLQMKDLKSPLDCPEGPLGATTKSDAGQRRVTDALSPRSFQQKDDVGLELPRPARRDAPFGKQSSHRRSC
ncbi:MAG: hypothetical protein U0263_36375 [Polyangiaceae bacterium]